MDGGAEELEHLAGAVIAGSPEALTRLWDVLVRPDGPFVCADWLITALPAGGTELDFALTCFVKALKSSTLSGEALAPVFERTWRAIQEVLLATLAIEYSDRQRARLSGLAGFGIWLLNGPGAILEYAMVPGLDFVLLVCEALDLADQLNRSVNVDPALKFHLATLTDVAAGIVLSSVETGCIDRLHNRLVMHVIRLKGRLTDEECQSWLAQVSSCADLADLADVLGLLVHSTCDAPERPALTTITSVYAVALQILAGIPRGICVTEVFRGVRALTFTIFELLEEGCPEFIRASSPHAVVHWACLQLEAEAERARLAIAFSWAGEPDDLTISWEAEILCEVALALAPELASTTIGPLLDEWPTVEAYGTGD